ncbi:MAG: hypothetical protein JKZ00_04580 [Flavobacteriaceae bacterium]|nr:hypothetical protein [Flavobacteriaceae bacterium]
MGQNLKKLFEQDRLVNHKRKENHEDLFIEQLYKELPVKRSTSFSGFRIAASVLVLLGIGIMSYMFMDNPFNQKDEITAFTLKNISPELEEIESFYVTNINLTLLDIEKNSENQAFVKRYMKRLSLLKEEYKKLITEMNEEGPNSLSINVLINNLKLQLELLQELNKQITSTKNKKHEII